MNIDGFSLLLSVAVLGLLTLTITSMLVYITVPTLRSKMHTVGYWWYIKLISIVALISTLSVLTYQYVFDTPVCEFCWWQRIFMFPIDIIALVSVYCSIKRNEAVIMALSFLGFLFATYHYYHHYQSVVNGKEVVMPCSSVGIIPACTDASVVVFGFVTIPLMALIAFAAIGWLAFLAWRSGQYN